MDRETDGLMDGWRDGWWRGGGKDRGMQNGRTHIRLYRAEEELRPGFVRPGFYDNKGQEAFWPERL